MLFRSILLAALLVAIPATCIGASPSRSGDISLHRVADDLGLAYAWLGPETAVSLSRPGLIIVIHPGQAWFQVNDATETTTAVPRFVENDVYISRHLFARLQQLARTTGVNPSTAGVAPAATRSSAYKQAPPIAGGSLMLTAAPAHGSEAIAISGKVAPTAVPVTLTLWSTISRDLPTIVVRRQVVAPDTNGDFQTTMSIAPGYFRGSFLKVVASVPGIAPATAEVTVHAPNAGVTGAADEIPSFVK